MWHQTKSSNVTLNIFPINIVLAILLSAVWHIFKQKKTSVKRRRTDPLLTLLRSLMKIFNVDSHFCSSHKVLRLSTRVIDGRIVIIKNSTTAVNQVVFVDKVRQRSQKSFRKPEVQVNDIFGNRYLFCLRDSWKSTVNKSQDFVLCMKLSWRAAATSSSVGFSFQCSLKSFE